jgi:hypothetical protein
MQMKQATKTLICAIFERLPVRAKLALMSLLTADSRIPPQTWQLACERLTPASVDGADIPAGHLSSTRDRFAERTARMLVGGTRQDFPIFGYIAAVGCGGQLLKTWRERSPRSCSTSRKLGDSDALDTLGRQTVRPAVTVSSSESALRKVDLVDDALIGLRVGSEYRALAGVSADTGSSRQTLWPFILREDFWSSMRTSLSLLRSDGGRLLH